MISLFLAVTVPLAMAFQRPPQPAFYSQATALLLWAIVVLLASLIRLQERNIPRGPLSLAGRIVLAVWGLLLAVTLGQMLQGHSPAFIALPLAIALLTAGAASAVALLLGDDAARRQRLLSTVMAGIIAAALVNVVAAAVQSLAPGWADDEWIARLGVIGERVGGNLRQPNQLATLMVWGMLAASWLAWRSKLLWLLLCVPMLVVLIASGSRSGVLSLALIIAVALFRSQALRRLHLRGWVGLLLALLVIGWFAEAVFSRATASAALQQRLALWRDVLVLISHSPWFGVGMGQLNFAWTLTPLPARAPDVFDHAHSLPLQLAAELGIPVALLILAGLAAVFVSARAALKSRAGMTAALTLATVLLHSLFEYPLWFAYFLMPTAFLLGWLAAAGGSAADVKPAASDADTNRQSSARLKGATALALACVVAAASAGASVLYALGEYAKAAAIHSRNANRAALELSVSIARESPIYGHFGDYAAIMLADVEAPLAWFARPIRHVLDERLLATYALALAREGQPERAAFVAARAREFPPHIIFERLRRIGPAPVASAPGRPVITGPESFAR